MHGLTEEQYQTEAEPILRQIFVNDDPFDQPFSPNITARLIIYPCECYVDQPLIDAVISAASNLKDTGCYLSLLWQHLYRPNHCYIPFSEFNAGRIERLTHRKQIQQDELPIVSSDRGSRPHAERIIIEWARSEGLKVDIIAPNHDICPECAKLMEQENVRAGSPLQPPGGRPTQARK